VINRVVWIIDLTYLCMWCVRVIWLQAKHLSWRKSSAMCSTYRSKKYKVKLTVNDLICRWYEYMEACDFQIVSLKLACCSSFRPSPWNEWSPIYWGELYLSTLIVLFFCNIWICLADLRHPIRQLWTVVKSKEGCGHSWLHGAPTNSVQKFKQ